MLHVCFVDNLRRLLKSCARAHLQARQLVLHEIAVLDFEEASGAAALFTVRSVSHVAFFTCVVGGHNRRLNSLRVRRSICLLQGFELRSPLDWQKQRTFLQGVLYCDWRLRLGRQQRDGCRLGELKQRDPHFRALEANTYDVKLRVWEVEIL